MRNVYVRFRARGMPSLPKDQGHTPCRIRLRLAAGSHLRDCMVTGSNVWKAQRVLDATCQGFCPESISTWKRPKSEVKYLKSIKQ